MTDNGLIDEWPQAKLLTAQYILKDGSGSIGGGFNSRVFGQTYEEACGYPSRPDRYRAAGWECADKMIKEGKIYYTHRFQHKAYGVICKGRAFKYGGFWVCNTCGSKSVDEPWWNVKVMKDGNTWCCIGLGFQNLQESENYAFGDTREEALANYEKLMMEANQ